MSSAQQAKRPYKVLHALTGAAGQPRALTKALRHSGLHADCVLLGESRLGYSADFYIDRTKNDLNGIAEFLKQHAERYDIFHFHFRPFFYEDSKDHRFPSFVDLLALKAAGKKIVFHFRGSEVRFNDAFKEMSPFNYVDENASRLTDKFPDQSKRRHIELVKSLADKVLVNDAEIASYVGKSTIINRIVDEKKFSYVGVSDNSRPLIIHAPSRRGVKGTKYVLSAIDTLKNEGLNFDFELIENLNHNEAINLYKKADIIVDQLRIGWYGVLSVEAMALGKAVVCYIRDDLVANFEDVCPVYNANPNNITDAIRNLVQDKQLRRKLGQAGHKWFRDNHLSEVVIPKLVNVYDDVMMHETSVSLEPIFDLIKHQVEINNDRLNSAYLGQNLNNPEGWYPTKSYSKAAFLLETQGVRALVKRTLNKLIP